MKPLVQLKAEDCESPLADWMIGRRRKLQSTLGSLHLPDRFMQGTTGLITEHRLVDVVQVPPSITEVKPGDTVIVHELDQQWCELPQDRQTCKIPLECCWGLYKETGLKLFKDRVLVKMIEIEEMKGSLVLPDCYREVRKDKGFVLMSTLNGVKKGDKIIFTKFKGGGLEFNWLGVGVILMLQAKDVHCVFDSEETCYV